MFKSTPIAFSLSRTVNPRSAITEMSDFPLSLSISPDTDVNCTSEIDPMYNCETKLTAPFGVHPTITFMVYSSTRLMTVTANQSGSQ